MDERIEIIDGWMPTLSLKWIENKVLSLPKNAVIVELGSWLGRSTAVFATTIGPNMCFVTVDSWLGQVDLISSAHKTVTERDIFLEFLRNMNNLGYNPLWYNGQIWGFFYLRMDSVVAPMLFDDGSIDMIFIDCDHTQVGKDIDAWYPKIRKSGIISGHDYEWVGVAPQVDSRVKVIEVVESIWCGIKE